jgi:autotransporter-associated beta strand protein
MKEKSYRRPINWPFSNYRATALAVLLSLCPASAQDITATGSQPLGAHWNQATWTGGQWSDGLVPSAGKSYSTGGFVVRTTDNSSSIFGGDSLRVPSGGGLYLKQNYGGTATIGTLILDGGTLFSATGSIGTDLQIVSGNLQVASNSFVTLSGSDNRRISIRNGAFSGSGNLTIQNGGDTNDLFQLESTVTSSHTGNWIINGGRVVISLDSQIHNLASVTLGGSAATLEIRSSQAIGSLAGTDGRITASGAFTLTTGADNTNTTFAGVISNAGTVSLTKTGNGTLLLSNANTFTGTVVVNDGILQISNNSSLGSTGKTVQVIGDGATSLNPELQLTNNINVTMQTLQVSGAGSGAAVTGALNNLSGANTINATTQIDLTGGNGGSTFYSTAGILTINSPKISANTTLRTFRLAGSGDGIINASIQNGSTVNMPLTKSGTGTWTLTGANTYTGATIVSAGKLLVNGSLTGTSSVTVAANATLGGSGSIATTGAFTVTGTLSPGNSLGLLTVTGGPVTIASDGTLLMEIANGSPLPNGITPSGPVIINDGEIDYTAITGGTPATPPTTNDVVVGNVTFDTSSTLEVQMLPATLDPADLVKGLAWKLIQGSIVGNFDINLDPLATDYTLNGDNWAVTAGGIKLNLPDLWFGESWGYYNWDLSLMQSDGIIILVPEPSRALLGLLALLPIALRRR